MTVSLKSAIFQGVRGVTACHKRRYLLRERMSQLRFLLNSQEQQGIGDKRMSERYSEIIAVAALFCGKRSPVYCSGLSFRMFMVPL